MKKIRALGLVFAVLLILCFCSCSFGQSVYFLFFGSNNSITSLDGQVLEEPDFVDYPVSRILYSGLSSLQQQAYRLIYNSVFSHKSKIQIPKISQSELTEVMIAIRGDNPHLLCLDRTYTYYEAPKSCFVLPDYTRNAEECAALTSLLMEKARELISSIPESADEFIKELYLHNSICAECTYADGAFSDNAYGALIDGKALCEGYTMGFKLLLDMAGFTSSVVRGNAENINGEKDAHIWNIVKLGAGWYYTDVTWDDPITNSELSNLRHSYFNISEKELSLSHSDYVLPDNITVSGGKYDYFIHTGLYLSEDNLQEKLNEKIGEAALQNGAHLELKFESSHLFDETVKDLFSNGGLQKIVCSFVSADSFLCSYSTDKDVNVLHIYLSFQ
ncbi:MAG: hypothetical protein J1E34_00390 [Oscillospiraceae bacterium]|nr:hypothetical protein [Oscillospiraceae bacterium]